MIELIAKSRGFKNLISAMESQTYPIGVTGINFPGFVFQLMSLLEHQPKVFVLVENYRISKRLYEQLQVFDIPVFEFPENEIHFFKSYSHSKEIENTRLNAIYQLKELKKAVVLLTPNSLMSPLMPFSHFSQREIKIAIGASFDMDEFCEKLVSFGYERVDIISSTAQFARRGSIVDVFSPVETSPYRIEFFGDDIDSIRSFDEQTQLSTGNVNAITIRPAKLSLLFEKKEEYVKGLKTKLKKLREQEDEPAQLLSHKYQEVIDEIERSTFLDEGFKYIPVLEPHFESISDYFPLPVIAWNLPNILNSISEGFEAFRIRFEDELLAGNALHEQIHLVADLERFRSKMESSKLIVFNPLSFVGSEIEENTSITCEYKEVGLYHKNIKRISADLNKWYSRGYTIVIALSTQNRIKGMKQLLEDIGLSMSFVEISALKYAKPKKINLLQKSVNAGFICEEEELVLIGEYELYDEVQANKGKKHASKKTTRAFFDVEINDFVVHETYGIGRYLGVHQIEVDGDIKDYLKILYRNEDILYVEVEKMDMVKKYIGDEAKNIKLSKLGSIEWKNTKTRVKKEVEEIAAELVELYAKRSRQQGFAFSEDSIWQKEFEDSFEHSETNDQLKAIMEIKKDMESKRPMDRLLCGDVGYGKTEVAIRAIFKAVQDSKQVAFLVPTTILAQQHYNTMKNRFKDYPIRIEMMSRFKGAKDQKLILNDIEKGICDVVVGTHRILSNDLLFKDFGLLVIDEEQRFGVKDKEKIKQLKNNIDVLTLSATPIPRTLHMSLMGIRDMSLIEEPPEDRYPVQTYVVDYNDAVIKDAINRELSRGGQIYFVHNRVKDIESISASLKRLIPDLRVAIAHGQMSSKELEHIMLGFMNKEYDVLVSTVIIETGLDIPNVNTIIINNADHFGLSQLYQLKGRVGRSNRIGYAYLLYSPEKSMNETSQKRLKAIKEFSELGAGFKIAMRDLEIRGAGNLLGMRQHGHMVSVGYELYSKMVEDVMNTLTGSQGEEATEINYSDRASEFKIDIRCSAYIPDNYISDYRYKIEFYKKISAMKNERDRLDIEGELIDMFGDIPDVVMNLIKIGYIKALCVQLGISNVSDLNDKVRFKLFEDYNVSNEALIRLMGEYKNRLSLASKDKPVLLLKSNRRMSSKSMLLMDIIEFLDKLVSINQEQMQ